MIGFVIKRLLMLIPSFIGITLFVFILIHSISGDPIMVMAGERGIDDARRLQLMAELGLDLPLWQQYLNYLWDVLHLNLGKSFTTQETVWNEFMDRFPATVELSFFAMVLGTGIGIPLGVLSALASRSKSGFMRLVDNFIGAFSLSGYSMPIFWWALLLIAYFSIYLGITPVSGRISVIYWIEPITGFMLIDTIKAGDWDAFWNALHHLVLPALALGTIPLAVVTRMTRSAMTEVLREDYIRVCRAKGLSPARTIFIHALRNSLIPVITVIGLQVGALIGGAILTETIFSWPGIGKWLVESIGRRDYPIIQGGILLIAFLVIITNFIVDLTYGIVNPRIRHSR